MDDVKTKEPTGKERMRRRAPSDLSLRPKRFEFDIKKAYSQEQLAEIGAIALVWNQIEAHVQSLMFIAFHSFFPSFGVWIEILKKIKTIDGHIDILRKYADENDILDDKAKACIKSAFDAVLEYRTYRNGIVHSSVFDHEKGIAVYFDPRSEPWQILLTIEALTALYDRLVLLKSELVQIDLLYRIAEGEGRVQVMNPKTGQPEHDQQKALRERAVPEQTARVLLHQNKRQSLPPLPKFPDAHLILPKMEDEEIPPHFGETDQ